MPEEMERKLKKQALKKGRKFAYKKDGRTILTKRGESYVYGTLRKTGWEPST